MTKSAIRAAEQEYRWEVKRFQSWVSTLSHTPPDKIDFHAFTRWAEHLQELAKRSPTAHYYKNRDQYAYPQWVYVAITDADEILYIGVTKNPSSRIQQHIDSGSPWISEPVRIEWHGYPDRQTALAAERDLIREYKPPFNIQGNDTYNPWSIK